MAFKMHNNALFLCPLLGALACAPEPPPAARSPVAPAAIAPEYAPMLELTIREAADVRSVTQALRQAALDGADAAHIHIAATELVGISLQVGATLTAPLMDITVDGNTALRESHLSIRGRSVTISGLTFVGNARTGDALQVTAHDAITLSALAFVGQTTRATAKAKRPGAKGRGARTSGRPLVLWAQGPTTAATIRDLVIADTTVTPAVSFGGKPGGRFHEITVSDSVFANTPSPVVHVAAAVGVSLDGVRSDAEDAVQPVSPAILVMGDVAPLREVPDALVQARAHTARPEPDR